MRETCGSCRETYHSDNMYDCPRCQGTYCYRCKDAHLAECPTKKKAPGEAAGTP